MASKQFPWDRFRYVHALCCLICVTAHQAVAQPPPSPLPVRQVTLFTSGVAYTERSGSVTGNASVPLVFNTAQINDILKSMVLLDRGGKVQPATYASRDPIGKTLQGFAVDVTEDLSQSDLLGKIRGARVVIEGAGQPALEGQIIGVEDRQIGGDTNNPINNSYLNLLTGSGITSIRLDAGRTVRILDERLNGELHQALSTLATGTDTQRRQVMLHFAGNGKRDVHVAYVMESPIWKISYRLLLSGSDDSLPQKAQKQQKAQKTQNALKSSLAVSGVAAKPYLQGWALVENTTDEDWKGVKLSLVSGRPVSFIQDLYQPLYIPRPEVGPDIVASPYPQTHDENLLADNAAGQRRAGGASATVLNINGDTVILNSGSRDGVKVGDRMQVMRDDGNGNMMPIGELLIQRAYATDSEAQVIHNTGGIRPEDVAQVMNGTMALTGKLPLIGSLYRNKSSNDLTALSNNSVINTKLSNPGFGMDGSLDMPESVVAQATGARSGELFKYVIDSPVTLPRRQAAMIPVIARDIYADRLSIFNASLDGSFAMNALRIRNNTPLHLKGGPITLFDGGTYAGDAKMEDVPPGDSRLISYAVDLSMVCNRQAHVLPDRRTTISVRRGVFIETRREQTETLYTLKSRGSKPRVVLVEHPIISGYHLVSPARADERTASVYRFAVTVPPGKTQTLKVATERPASTTVALADLPVDRLVAYSTYGQISAKLKAALEEIVRRRRVIDNLTALWKSKTDESDGIDSDQDRIRKNMAGLDKDSSLYKRYVSKLDGQETRIENLRKEAASMQNQVHAAEQSLKAFIDGIHE